MAKNNDKELLSLFRDENTRHYAFNIIIRKYQERLYWHVRRIVISHDDADDVIQNTFIRVWNGLEKFHEASKLYTWLYRIATNEALSFLKQYKQVLPIRKVMRVYQAENQYKNFLLRQIRDQRQNLPQRRKF
ncbi:hypothetical protein ES705_44244 [subsurface metagenome]